jgi:hypothetical protein
MTWDAEAVAAALKDAANTMQRLPVAGCKPAGYVGLAAGFCKGASHPVQMFSATQVDAMDTVLAWPDVLPNSRNRMAVRLYADGVTYRRLGTLLGVSAVAAHKLHHRACGAIARALNQGRLAVPPGLRVPTFQPLSHAA